MKLNMNTQKKDAVMIHLQLRKGQIDGDKHWLESFLCSTSQLLRARKKLMETNGQYGVPSQNQLTTKGVVHLSYKESEFYWFFQCWFLNISTETNIGQRASFATDLQTIHLSDSQFSCVVYILPSIRNSSFTFLLRRLFNKKQTPSLT